MTRWIADWMLCGERPDGLLPGKGGNRTDRIGAGRDSLRDTVERYYLVDTKPSATVVHRHVQAAFEDHNKVATGSPPPHAQLPGDAGSDPDDQPVRGGSIAAAARAWRFTGTVP